MNIKEYKFRRGSRENERDDDKSRVRITSTTTTRTSITTTTTTSSKGVTSQTNAYTTTSPKDIDVLCGRGGKIIQHAGNVYFRTLVDSRKGYYQSKACLKSEKRDIGRAIVAAIQNNGGRFLEKCQCQQENNHEKTNEFGDFVNNKENLWVEIDDNKAVMKTSQALRERIKKGRGNSSFSTSRAQPSSNSCTNRGIEQSNVFSGKNSVISSCRESMGVFNKKNQRGQNARQQGVCRDMAAVANACMPTFLRTASSSEWKLFDFGVEEESKCPQQSGGSLHSFASAMPQLQFQTSNRMGRMLSSRLSGNRNLNSQPLVHSASIALPMEGQAEEV